MHDLLAVFQATLQKLLRRSLNIIAEKSGNKPNSDKV